MSAWVCYIKIYFLAVLKMLWIYSIKAFVLLLKTGIANLCHSSASRVVCSLFIVLLFALWIVLQTETIFFNLCVFICVLKQKLLQWCYNSTITTVHNTFGTWDNSMLSDENLNQPCKHILFKWCCLETGDEKCSNQCAAVRISQREFVSKACGDICKSAASVRGGG